MCGVAILIMATFVPVCAALGFVNRGLILKSLTLAPAHAPELINLGYLAAEYEYRRCVIHPDHDDHDRGDRPFVNRSGIERLHIGAEHSLRELEHEAREERGNERGLPANVAVGKK